MAIHTVNGYVVATRYSYEKTPTFGFQMHKPSAEYAPQTVIVREHQIDIEVEDGTDITAGLVANLEAKKRHLRQQLANELIRVDNEIGKLTSLEFTPTPVPSDDIPF